MTRLLIVTAVDAECDAVLAGLHGRGNRLPWPPAGMRPDAGAGPGATTADPGATTTRPDATMTGPGGATTGIDVVAAGVGSAAAAGCAGVLAAMAWAAGRPYTVLASAGIAGGFAGRAHVGDTVIGTRSIAADLGVEVPGGFLAISALGFGTDTVDADAALVRRLREALPAAVAGPVLSVTTVTGTATRGAELRERHPDAAAEAMEGFGVAGIARLYGMPFVEVRTISNLVGPRDRDAWRIPDALAALTAAARVMGTLVG